MASDDKSELRSDLDQLRKDLQALRDDLGNATASVYQAGRQSLNSAGEQARQGADMAGQYVRESVTERPVTSLLVAAGVGVLLGIFFRRS
jgi:ElaB/YqjD/DUF883 family membrane-anchored ribosome-binding protein